MSKPTSKSQLSINLEAAAEEEEDNASEETQQNEEPSLPTPPAEALDLIQAEDLELLQPAEDLDLIPALDEAQGPLLTSTTDPISGDGPQSTNIEPSESSEESKKEKHHHHHEGGTGNRCQVCRKKVGLTGIVCRCGGLFCPEHRYTDKHNCTFDYKQLGAEEIRKNNPVIVSEKIHKI